MAAATLYNDLNSNRSLRLQTLVRLRWLAVGGQSLAVIVTALWLQFPLPVVPCSVLIACLALLNVFLTLRFPPTQRLTPPAAFTLLGIDLAQLTALLFITGGLANPFAPLLCVPVIISSASQPKPQSIVLAGLAVLGVTALAFSPFPLPWYPGTLLLMPRVLTAGIWFAIVSMTAFAAFYTYRVSLEASELSEALTATELVLQREKHLSQLDGLAAAAAHELGTPLATISVVAKEMERELGDDPRFGEDVHLLRSQSERCRDILRRLTTLSSESEEHMRLLPLSSLIEEVMAPHREFGIEIELKEQGDRASEPVGIRNAGILYGLGNLLENAVDYARKKVTVTTEHTAERVRVTIEDDGDGFSPDILARIGEPYVTRRQKDDSAGGLGLGLFIAKTLLERSGARLRFENGGSKHPGARVSVEWPRVLMDTKLAK
ncbi:ActS/PrrB/RegB family redox-sensitive histidine kinase [Sinorhizobium meliloti WSM1022]|jgi:two-component system sensor histidine kinase RegB|uniref:histidine kinase n=3 Tax=Rhizobium meliloti TaxID=382 RepID=Q92TA1_RHIME|nr:ActS/PrrB/RegB family redox-sensitive histidine kinase [Sinorhizobium meliloti]PST30223.1 sensor histidine kinase [Mesorhizobium loti]TWA88227.1 two-component system sensor histidine kinase RegB [Ensifer sp. SEMIA 134]TWB23814.1 two-component system sensor histidine kinase RegB [Ensifer sp. SEMIA 135]AEG06068.1 integral membrane sensor signal transduction histidine kinase [Sinorhizobium meliloti BL225C]AEG55103.1 integral membrane sensor signal transduction histidine kinase [Sinorhizobium m